MEERRESLPIVMMTDVHDAERAAEAIRQGAADFVLRTPEILNLVPMVVEKNLEAERIRAENRRLQAALAGLTAMETWSGVEALPNIASPTLVLWGDGDRAYQWQQPEQLWQTIPGAGLAVVPDCSHAVHLEKTDLFNALLMDFLASAAD